MHIPVSTIRLSFDGQKIYSASKDSNELYETDLKTGITKILSIIDEEEEREDLFFDIVSWGNKLLLVPRNATSFYVLDLITGKHEAYLKRDICSVLDDEGIGFFSFLYGNRIYVVYREYPVVLNYDIESEQWSMVNDEYISEKLDLITYDFNEDRSIFFSKDKSRMILYKIKNNKMTEVSLDSNNDDISRVYIRGESIFVYKNNPSILTEYNVDGKKIRDFDVGFEEKSSPKIVWNNNDIELWSSYDGNIAKFDCSKGGKTNFKINIVPDRPYYWSDSTEDVICGIGYIEDVGHDLMTLVVVDRPRGDNKGIKIVPEGHFANGIFHTKEDYLSFKFVRAMRNNMIVGEDAAGLFTLERFMANVDKIAEDMYKKEYQIGSTIYQKVVNDSGT